MKRIYLDNAATTPLKPEVLQAMLPYLSGGGGTSDGFGNVSQVSENFFLARRLS